MREVYLVLVKLSPFHHAASDDPPRPALVAPMRLDDDMPMVEAVLDAIATTFKLAQGEEDILRRRDPTSEDSNNPTRGIDRVAQQNLKLRLDVIFERKILFIAEEPEPGEAAVPEDLVDSDVNVAILDPIDGTDLWLRGFGNWCISTVIFDPGKARIRAAFVGYSSGDIYWATPQSVCRRDLDGYHYPLVVSRTAGLALRDATICFYGQKPVNFLAIQQNLNLRQFLLSMKKEKERAEENGGDAPKFRIYNLAGNPMMVRMTESDGVHAAVDVVFEQRGQKAYDVVPGAYIAKRAGASLVNLLNKPINLDEALRYHKKLITYVLAATPQLGDEAVASLLPRKR
jgi:fructose-1,6-bisphosphatase/inositol monophosphatase family enzyme